MRKFKVDNLTKFRDLGISVRSQDIVYEKMDYVKQIVNDVKIRKDVALLEYTMKFDGVSISKDNIKVSQEEIQEALDKVEPSFVEAIKYAISNITKYHREQVPKDFIVSVDDGITLGRRWVPIETVGLYIPGGKSPYVTVCYMLAVPAKIAGCKNIIACVPPDKETGKINPYILVTAYLSGVTNIYKIGGAQAIAAMAFGTETIPKVGKIFGPGNVYVTAAKLLVYGITNIDAPAGPSEALIMADESAPVNYIASDIISQAEHDINSAAVLLTTSDDLAQEVENEVYKQMESLSRKKTIEESLSKFGVIIVCPNIETCIDIANDYAPEHIQIMTKNSTKIASQIVNAGSICIGKYTPIVMGDYISGVNNVIPTGGSAKNFSPLHIEAFMKCLQTQEIELEGLKKVNKYVEIICGVERFDAHYNSLKIRL